MPFADALTDGIAKGADFGPLGYVLMVLFLFVVVFLYFVYIPDRNQQRQQEAERFKGEESRKTQLAEATAKLCESMADNNRTTVATHAKVTETHEVATDIHTKATLLVEATKNVVDGLKKINSNLGGVASEEIGAARAVLHSIVGVIDEPTPLPAPLPPAKGDRK